MPKMYFDDALKTVNDHLDVNNWAAPGKWVNWDFQVKTKARDNFDISHQRKWESDWPTDAKGNQSVEKVTEKSKTDFKWSHHGMKYGFAMVSDAIKMDLSGTLADKDVKADGKVEYEWKHAKDDWKVKGVLNGCSPMMAEKFQMWLNTELTFNKKNDIAATMKLNNVWDVYSLGVGAKWEEDKWAQQHVQCVFNDKPNNRQIFGRFNVLESEAAIGASFDKDDFSHSYEARLKSGGEDGFSGTPVTIVGGGEKELSKKTSVNYTFTLGKHFVYNQNIEHKYDDKTTVTVSQAFDAECMQPNIKKPAHDFGVSFVYKL